jgi:hypothetical protein
MANKLNSFLSDLLNSGTIIEPSQAVSVINTIPSVSISDTVNILKKLSGVISQPVVFSADNFEGSLAPLKNKTISVNSSEYTINIPILSNLPPSSSVVAISWSNTTVFSNKTTASNIMSVSVSNSGKDTVIRNLSQPLILSWKLDPTQIVPPNSTLVCSYWNYTLLDWKSDGCNITSIIDNVVICECTHMTDFVARFERVGEMNKNLFENAGNVYSLDGLSRYKNYYIFYGCYFMLIILCGIGLQLLDIKNSKQYLQSLKENYDILKFKKEIKHFYIDKCYLYMNNLHKISDTPDSIDTLTTEEHDLYYEHQTYIDTLTNKIYLNFKSLNTNYTKNDLKEIIEIFVSEEITEQKNNKMIEDNKHNESKYPLCLILELWWKRLLYHHNYLSIFFKYDPQSPRIYRIFFIFTLISHTLFMTSLLFGYSHSFSNNSVSTDITSPIETIVLSIITSLINVPVLNFAMSALLLAGKSEFRWRYPFIYREIYKMVIFEEEYNKSKDRLEKSKVTKDTKEVIDADASGQNNEENFIINIMTQYLCLLCNRKKESKNTKDMTEIIKNRIDTELIKINNISQKYKWYYSSYIPFHTFRSAITFIGCLLYLLWTINYLLLFSANIQPAIQEEILKSFGISQLFSIFLIHPITLLLSLVFAWIYNILSNKYITNTKKISKPLYFYSDPFINNKSLGLTTGLSKSLFLTSIATSSIHQPTDDRIIAPPKGLIAQLTDIKLNELNKEYYDQILVYNTQYKYK